MQRSAMILNAGLLSAVFSAALETAVFNNNGEATAAEPSIMNCLLAICFFESMLTLRRFL